MTFEELVKAHEAHDAARAKIRPAQDALDRAKDAAAKALDAFDDAQNEAIKTMPPEELARYSAWKREQRKAPKRGGK